MDKGRIQDYQALAAENQILAYEIAKLKAKKEKPMRPRPDPIPARIVGAIRGVAEYWPGILLLFLAAGVIWFGYWKLHGINLDLAESSKPVDCYKIAQESGRSNPWDRYYIWEIRNGREWSWERKAEPTGFDYTIEGARKILAQYGLKECR